MQNKRKTVSAIIWSNFAEGWRLGPGFPLRHISGVFGRTYHVTTIKGAGKVHIRPNSSDAQSFVQVFCNKHYDLSDSVHFSRVMAVYQNILSAGQTPFIIDAGANVGAASIWFARQFPLARILAVEPNKDNAKVCRLNTVALPNVKVIEAAIGSEGGRVLLINPTNQAWAVQTTRSNDGGVEVRSINMLLHEERGSGKLLIVKIDIEGFEDDLFKANTEWVDEVEVIIIEPHDWMMPGKGKSLNFQKALAERDFEILISGDNLVYIRLPRDPGAEICTRR